MSEDTAGTRSARRDDELGRLVDELPREAVPPDRVEHDTVRRLRAQGLLRRPGRASALGPARVRIAAAVAGLAVFGAGYMVGVSGATDGSIDAPSSGREISTPERLESASDEFFAAVAKLSAAAGGDGGNDPAREQVRDVLRRSLEQSSLALLSVDPGNPMGEEIVRGLERSRTPNADQETAATERTIQWY